MIKHYKGKLGEFDYDDTLWEICLKRELPGYSKDVAESEDQVVHYIGNSSVVNIPKGLINYCLLFYKCIFNDTFILEYADLTNCISADRMFSYCKFLKGIDLKNNFDTRNCKNKNFHMLFVESEFYDFINLGSNFYIFSSGTMFGWCKFQTGCNLKDLKCNIDLSEEVCVGECFSGCYFNDDFYLPDEDFIWLMAENNGNEDVSPSHYPSYAMSEEDNKWFEHVNKHFWDKNFEIDYDAYETKMKEAFNKMRKGGSLVTRCRQEMLKLLKEGKSKEDVIANLSTNSEFNKGMLQSIYCTIESSLVNKCSFEVNNMFKIEDVKSHYTVGEIRKALLQKGYPKDIVNDCIVNYLENEYLFI